MRPLYCLFFWLIFASLSLSAQPDCVADNCCCGNVVQYPFPAGNFDDPPFPAPGGIITFFAGDMYSDWSIDGGSIDLLDGDYNGWAAGNPNGATNFIDLNGSQAGTISAPLNGLTIGCTYTIVLWYAKNAGIGSANCTIEVEDGDWLSQTWTATNNGANGWIESCFTFTALATASELTFIGSGGAPNRGVLLDDITIWQCCGDTEAPVVEALPSPIAAECGDPLPPVPSPNITDNCPLPIETVYAEDGSPAPCFYTITREWLVTDACGNTATATQIIEVVDTEAPVFDVPPSDYTAICSENYLGEFFDWIAANGYASASDACGEPVSWTISYAGLPDAFCGATQVDFTVTDICGNSTELAAFFIVEDNDPPELITPAQNMTVNCDPNADILFFEWLDNHAGATVDDPCGEVLWDNNFSGGAPGSMNIITFTATDGCSNSVSTTAFFFQPSIVNTVHIDTSTCNPSLAGIDTVQTALGNCLTITITNTVLLDADTTLIFETSCNAQQAGVFSQNLSNQNGCDSIVITTITWTPNDTILISDNTCDPNLAGVFTQNLVNQAGCDSIVVTTLQLVLVDSTLVFNHTCDFAQSGVFTQNLLGQSGCDSVVITTISWVPPDTVMLFQNTCEAALAGIFQQQLSNQFGCDSLVITTINLLSSDTTLIFGTSCDSSQTGVFTQNLSNQNGCDSLVLTTIAYSLSDTTLVAGAPSCDPAATGIFVQELLNANGCDSVVITTISLLPDIFTTLTSTTCDPSQAGVFTQILSSYQGCDSIVTSTVQLITGFNTQIASSTCDPTLAGIFVQNFISQNGCDSTVTTTVSLLTGTSTQLSANTCDPAQVGVFVQNLIGSNGCDSIVTTTVSLLQGTSTQLSANTCDPAQVGVFVQNLIGINGCDSVVTTTLSFLPNTSTQLSASTCDPAQVGVFVQNLIGINGCDSIVTTTVSLLPSTSTQLSTSTCDPTQTGVFVQNLIGINGCDSIITTTVSLIPSASTLLSASTCDPAQEGIFVQNLVGINGCDSMVTTTVSLLPLPQGVLEVSEFNGFSLSCADSQDGAIIVEITGNGPFQYNWSTGSTESQLAQLAAGLYSVTVTSAAGCTSIEQVQLTAPPPMEFGLELIQPNCLGQDFGSVTASAIGGVLPYEYSLDGVNFQTPALFDHLAEGAYQMVVRDQNGCVLSDQLQIIAPNGPTVSLGPDQELMLGDSLFIHALLNVPADSIALIQWTLPGVTSLCSNCLTQAFLPFNTNTYLLEVQDHNGCRATDAILVRINKSKSIYVPNIFSPNEDGFNDWVTVFARPSAIRKVQRFQIYNRWGEQVFQLLDFLPEPNPGSGWDGTYRGQALNPAVFVWFARVEFADGTIEDFSGDVTLIR